MALIVPNTKGANQCKRIHCFNFLSTLFAVMSCIKTGQAFQFLSPRSTLRNFNPLSVKIDIDEIPLKASPKTRSNKITITKVSTPEEICALGDLRYDEWINTNHSNDTDNMRTPSRHAFRMATNEIFQERSNDGAVALLACVQSESDIVTVGAAELSPVEFKNTLKTISPLSSTTQTILNKNQLWYVTDVVTSQAHRRRGIGKSMIMEMEKICKDDKGGKAVFLHVEKENKNALKFYEKFGYAIIHTSQEEKGMNRNDKKMIWNIPLHHKIIQENTELVLDLYQLAENAGTKGQLLLVKTLDNITPFKIHSMSNVSNEIKRRTRGGFGCVSNADTKKKSNTRTKKKSKSRRP